MSAPADARVAGLSVVVAGAGSIGRRHLRNLRDLGVGRLAACDPDPARRKAVADELGVAALAGLDEALDAGPPDAVLVCSPPVSHVSQALRAVERGAHVFVEKPLAHSLAGVEELAARARAAARAVQVGYNLRFHPGIRQLKGLVDAGAVGRVLWLHGEFGFDLREWRPGRDYRTNYSARADLGGGIILDASHEIDYVLWLLGQPTEVVCMAGKVSGLEMDVADCATVLLRFPGGGPADGPQADIHMDCVQRVRRRACRIAGTEGTLVWDYDEREIQVFRAARKQWERLPYRFEENDMYVAELRHFLDCVLGRATPLVGLDEGRRALAVALAAQTAARERRVERLA